MNATTEAAPEGSSPPMALRQLEAKVLAGTTRDLNNPDRIGPVVREMFQDALGHFIQAGVTPGVGISLYDDTSGPGIHFTVGFIHEGGPIEGLQLIDLPGTDALVMEHHGSMAKIGQSWQILHDDLAARRLEAAGAGRELYVRMDPPDDQSEWVTEIQQPVRRALSRRVQRRGAATATGPRSSV